MHHGMEVFLRLDAGMTDKFKIDNGLRQGCVMAPALFNLFFASVFHKAFHDLPKHFETSIKSRNDGRFFTAAQHRLKRGSSIHHCEDLQYAEDCALYAHSVKELQGYMSRFGSAAKISGLTVSFEKTEVLTNLLCDSKTLTLLDGKPLKITKHFKCLGGVISKDSSLDK